MRRTLAGGLFRAVFAGAVGERWRQSLDRAQTGQAAIRIRLRFANCPELAELPWELLYDRDGDRFVALSGSTSVVRYVQPLRLPPPPIHAAPLRVLVIRSEPSDLPRLDLAAKWAQVRAALTAVTGTGSVTFTELIDPAPGELRQALAETDFHALHYLGHAAFDGQQGGALLLTGPDGRSQPVASSELGLILGEQGSIRLAVVSSCEAGRPEPADPFAVIAWTLARHGVPTVVAMQFEVSTTAAAELTPALYGALAAGQSIDDALAQARRATSGVGPMEWATPALYLSTDEIHLFDPGEPVEPGPGRAMDLAGHADELRRQCRFSEAETAYRAALEFDHGLAAALAGLGDVQRELRRYPESEQSCREAIQLALMQPLPMPPWPSSSARSTGYRRRRLPRRRRSAWIPVCPTLIPPWAPS